jgi:hypothetical protein
MNFESVMFWFEVVPCTELYSYTLLNSQRLSFLVYKQGENSGFFLRLL